MQNKDISRHPCFNKGASGGCGRVHLPVAPRCNIQCNYCNRKYDCVNESRPGVASAVLKPWQASAYMDEVLAKEPRITVAGIAGPGDPMANAAETLATLRLLKERHPHLLFCLSSNGLAMPEHLDELVELGVTHMTITMNTVDPEIGSRIYSWVRDGKVVYRGREAAELLLERQLTALSALQHQDVLVKVNTIVIPGVNDQHIQDVADMAARYDVSIMNCIPLKPTADTPFENLEEPSKEMVRELRSQIGGTVKQMTHCRRCRADAVGLLCDDRSNELGPTLRSCASLKPAPTADRPNVAVASREGMLINQHLGEAKKFHIYGLENGVPVLKEERAAPSAGLGPKRWSKLGETLHDCRAVLASAMGDTPRMLLEEYGVTPHVVSGFIGPALEALFAGESLEQFRSRGNGLGGCCSGGLGGGCG